ncbi:ribonucleoside-triphosphate reductase, adenosylcobalamin-dependent [Micromonospora coerulea]|uniref:ribonucleoside-triphosphate reductase, adenosylcobalamin-dependent n=1 Tax=Micromonospora coerulea TaxID=47856 RepID=UPI001F2E40F9|nr:ribonucleoside-triphosphate reductase, adenosylcobalamin-dependent [Micromonospora veneta]
MTNWGPTGQTVYERTYSRTKHDGSKEAWPETVARVVQGNMSLVYGHPDRWTPELKHEAATLREYMEAFKILPAGRHLWASGVPGRQYLFNCHVAGWGAKLSDHYQFSFSRLMEGGGVGGNYSSHYLEPYGAPRRQLRTHIVCDPSHADYGKMQAAGLLSADYSHEWTGAYPVEDSREGWAAALVDLLDTFMTDAEVKHANRVYDVSRVRPEGSPLRTFGGTASGPLPFARMMENICRVMNGVSREVGHLNPVEAMEIDHEIGACVVAGGNRRSARMSMVHWADPFIFKFIDCKADPAKHWTTNVSVEIDDEFIRHLDQLRGGAPSRGNRNHAERVHKAVVTGMLTNGEPGYWNSSLSNEGEPNPVICTNPCGEIALREWENCNLGHVNLDAFIKEAGKADHEGLLKAHHLMTRFLIRATYGDVTDPKQAAMLADQRRIGVGHFGVQGFFSKMGIPFTRVPESEYAGTLLDMLYRAVRDEARAYSFALRIPEPVKVTTVAPTGTIAKLAGRTEGIHPVYARRFIRRVRFSDVDPDQWATVLRLVAAGHTAEPDRAAANTWVVEFPTTESLVAEVEALGLDPGELVESADEIPLERMLAYQAFYQERYADNAISFTVNVPAEPHQLAALAAGESTPPAPTPERVNTVAAELARWLPTLKGTTLMIDGSRPQAPYERLTDDQWAELTAPTSIADSVDEECATGACPVR